MDNSQIAKALTDLRPNSIWALMGDTLEGLEWLDELQTQPSIAEIEQAIANPLPEVEPTVEQKLASVGLSVDSLKAALGL